MNGVPVFLSSDNNYAASLCVAIASICDNTESFINFYILDGGIEQTNKNKIEKLHLQFSNFSLEYLKIDINKEFKNVKTKNNITLSAFNRFLIPYLKPEIDKAIYFDVDLVAMGDIFTLYNEDLDGYIIGAIPDQCAEVHIKKAKKILDMSDDSCYFNSGVLLIDCKKWRDNDITPELMKLEEKYREVRLHNDQDVLNQYFENNFKILNKKYNVIYENDQIIIRHYAGNIKPWQADFSLGVNNIPYKILNVDVFWKYAKYTEFYDELVKTYETFIKSNKLWQRYNKMVNK